MRSAKSSRTYLISRFTSAFLQESSVPCELLDVVGIVDLLSRTPEPNFRDSRGKLSTLSIGQVVERSSQLIGMTALVSLIGRKVAAGVASRFLDKLNKVIALELSEFNSF